MWGGVLHQLSVIFHVRYLLVSLAELSPCLDEPIFQASGVIVHADMFMYWVVMLWT